MEGALARSQSLFEDDAREQLRDIHTWSESTLDGSLADLPYTPLPAVWDEVASDHGNCMGRRCPTYRKCFYYQDRRRAQHAQILVVNHALFFSDLALRRHAVSTACGMPRASFSPTCGNGKPARAPRMAA
jgi:ATP-dependent DNA helicase DinG